MNISDTAIATVMAAVITAVVGPIFVSWCKARLASSTVFSREMVCSVTPAPASVEIKALSPQKLNETQQDVLRVATHIKFYQHPDSKIRYMPPGQD